MNIVLNAEGVLSYFDGNTLVPLADMLDDGIINGSANGLAGAPVRVTGARAVGAVLSLVLAPGWSYGGVQWKRDTTNASTGAVTTTNITGATSATYAQVAADVATGAQAYPVLSNLTYAARPSSNEPPVVVIPELAITGTPVTSLVAGQDLSFATNVTGGVPPYTRSVLNAPSGMTHDADGVKWTNVVAGNYPNITPRVVDAAGTQRNIAPFTLNVTAALVAAVITQHPANASVVGGNTASFSFTATNAVTLGWQTAGASGSFTDVSGATTKDLTTAALAHPADNGRRYRGFAIGTDGQRVYTNEAVVTTSAALKAASFTQHPANTSVVDGSAASFTVAVADAVSMGWQVAAPGGSFTDVSGATSVNYTTGALTHPTHDGRRYRAFAIGTDGVRVFSNEAVVTTTAVAPARAVITQQPEDQTITEGGSGTWTFQADYAVTYGWDVMNDGVTWTVVGNASTNTYTSVSQTLSQTGRKWRGWAAGTDGVKVYTDIATQTVVPTAPPPPMDEPAMQSMMLPATEFTSRGNITDNGDGTFTGTSGNVLQNSAYMTQPSGTPHLQAYTDDYIALEWMGGADVMACFSGTATQETYGGRWLQLGTDGVKWRASDTVTVIKAIGPVGSRYRLSRVGTVLTIDEEDASTGAWTTIYTFDAALANTANLFAVLRTSIGKIKPLHGYGIQKASQSQWIEPGFLNAGGSTFVSAAGESGEILLAKLVANRYRGSLLNVATIPPADDHNRAAIIDLASNKMLTAYTGHNADAFYTAASRSAASLDFNGPITTSVSPSRVSYAQLIRIPGTSRVFRMHRYGGASDGAWNLVWSDNEGTSWTGHQRMHGFPYCWALLAPDNRTLWVHAYGHPLSASVNHIWLFKIDLITGDYMHPNGTVAGNMFTGNGVPRITTANMLQIIAASGSPDSTRLCDVRETGDSRGITFIRFNKGAVDTSGQLMVGRYSSADGAYTETTVRAAGKAFAASNAYYPAHCFGADMNTVYAAYESATGIHVLRAYTWSGTAWVAGAVIRQITGIISRPRFHDGHLYWSELKSYVGSPTFSFKGTFKWKKMGATAALPAGTKPDAPTGVAGTAGDGSASVTGTAPSNTGTSALAQFRVTVSPGGAQFTGATLPIAVTGLTNGTAYTATMAAQNAEGLWSDESAASDAFTPAAATAPVGEPGVPLRARTLTNVVALGDNSYRASGSAAASQNGIIGTGLSVAADGEGWVQAEFFTPGSSYSFSFGTSASDTDPQGSASNYTLQVQATGDLGVRVGGAANTPAGSIARAAGTRVRFGRGTDGVFKVLTSTDSGATWTTAWTFSTPSTVKRYLRVYLTYATSQVGYEAREIIHPRTIGMTVE